MSIHALLLIIVFLFAISGIISSWYRSVLFHEKFWLE